MKKLIIKCLMPILIFFYVPSNAQSKISISTHFGQFFTGYKDRTGDKYMGGVNYNLNDKLKVSLSHSYLTYREKYSLYIDDKVLFIDNDFTNFPLPESVSEAYQKSQTNFGSKQLKPGYYNHQYNMTNIELKYKFLYKKFKFDLGLGTSFIKAQILEKGTEFDSKVIPYFSREEGLVRDIVPILIKYIDFGYVWSLNFGYKLTERSELQTIFTHSSYLKSAGPVSASIGIEVDL